MTYEHLRGYDESNTTTTPLGASETYTGDWASLPPDMRTLKISAATDVNSQLFVEFSHDKTNVITDPVNFSLSARDVFYVTASTDRKDTAVNARLSMNLYEVD